MLHSDLVCSTFLIFSFHLVSSVNQSLKSFYFPDMNKNRRDMLNIYLSSSLKWSQWPWRSLMWRSFADFSNRNHLFLEKRSSSRRVVSLDDSQQKKKNSGRFLRFLLSVKFVAFLLMLGSERGGDSVLYLSACYSSLNICHHKEIET